MNKYERILSSIKEQTPLLKMFERGVKPEEVRAAIIELLEPYFDNRDVLERFATEALVTESINLLKLKEERPFFEMFEKCLYTYHCAKVKDSETCFKCCADWQPKIVESVCRCWSVSHLEVDKDGLEIQEFLHECLSNIGDVVEGLMKPYLKVLLQQIRIIRGSKITFREIEDLDLGGIVNELIETSGYPDLFIPGPWRIRLNQWRNIAYHHSARVDRDKIICWWGKQPDIREIELSRGEMLEVVHTNYEVYRVLHLAYTLFFVDNVKEIKRLCSSLKVEVRSEAEFLSFAAGLSSHGFEIVEFKKSSDEVRLVVKDVSNLEPDERRYHASQFLFPLWHMTRSKKVITEYREKDDTPNLLVSISSTICEKIFNGELEPLTLAKRMEMLDLKTKKIIPAWKDS